MPKITRATWAKHIHNWTKDSIGPENKEAMDFFVANWEQAYEACKKENRFLKCAALYRGYTLSDSEYKKLVSKGELPKPVHPFISFSSEFRGVHDFVSSNYVGRRGTSRAHYGIVLVKKIDEEDIRIDINKLVTKWKLQQYAITDSDPRRTPRVCIATEAEILVDSSVVTKKVEKEEWFLLPDGCYL